MEDGSRSGTVHDELRASGFEVSPGDMGENVTTRGVDLLGLVTGLRNPCAQLDRFQQGPTAAVLTRDEQGRLVRKSGVMGIVLGSGTVRPGHSIRIELPPPPHRPLQPV